MVYKITKPDRNICGRIELPASKSISNRALIIRALTHEGFEISNLSKAVDTVRLFEQLNSTTNVKDAGDAGTAFRFLTALLATKRGSWILTGSDRMKERPIGPLVSALTELGAAISYLGQEGYPPLQINGKELKGGTIRIHAGVSSQFITALMLIAPVLKGGLNIQLTGHIVSGSYINMTASLMRYFGVGIKMEGPNIYIPQGSYQAKNFEVESDWSAASYYLALASLSTNADLELRRLRWDSIQGDRAIVKIMESFGLSVDFIQDGIGIRKSSYHIGDFLYDFIDQPDLAQTVMALCVAKGIDGHFKGIENLRIKETDRIQAMKTELAKVGGHLYENNGQWDILTIKNFKRSGPIIFHSYNDHRMAMSLACFSMIYDEIYIEEPLVVSKSNPSFWDHLENLDFIVERAVSN